MGEQGWKLYDKSVDERARARELLEKLPESTYTTLKTFLSPSSSEGLEHKWGFVMNFLVGVGCLEVPGPKLACCKRLDLEQFLC